MHKRWLMLLAVNEDAVVPNIEKRKRSRKAAPPFTTSTLQQDGVRKLNFGAKRTMMIAPTFI